ncbi:hypothetical protein [Hydrogenophaga sp. 2FB]|uniref:hypothetical protein n=1 Tax=Hydrogenophaga sp. 2FB TaxID=2502187 RepID=UPI0010F48127|nr:hypothetical protein [Hydrogenophaga sp. 2FB]
MQWWFNPKERQACTGPDFNEHQRQAILDVITVHEAPEGTEPRPARPVHEVALTCGTDQIQVVLALMVWQLLNYRASKMARLNDTRFTSHFLLVAHHACVRSRLFETLCGRVKVGDLGTRDFFTSDVVQLAPLLIPETRREEVLGFVRAHAGSGTRSLRQTQADGIVAITDGRVEALECLARLPSDAMVFDDETRSPYCTRNEDITTGLAWRRHLRSVASSRNGSGVQIVFTQSPPATGASGKVTKS